LLEKIVQRARELRRHRDSRIMGNIQGIPPTSHFHIPVSMESLLSTLELNFFLTKYYEMSDRDGRKVAIFALNFGLCQKFSIEYGRPTGKPAYRKYFIERVFDYTSILKVHLQSNQEISCDNCHTIFDVEQVEALRLFGMNCPTCKIGTCKITNLSKKYESLINSINEELLLPNTELGILQTLETEKRALNASEIAHELDSSYQLVGKRGKNLAERGLVIRAEENGRRIFSITEFAEQSYFSDTGNSDLNVESD
jgi:predicted transcriptional regulator